MTNACIVGRTRWIKLLSSLALAVTLGACGAQERTPPAAAPEPPPPAESAPKDSEQEMVAPAPAAAPAPMLREEEEPRSQRNGEGDRFSQPPGDDELTRAEANLA